jgi:5-formyltetrahydrofolate cyclo-ligase
VTIDLDKQALRQRVLAARDELTAEERRSKSEAVCRRLIALPELADAAAVLAFASFRSEVDTRPLIDSCLGRGLTVALPRVTRRHEMEAFAVVDPDGDLETGYCSIPEPRDGLEPIAPALLDVVVVPGAAFDAQGERVGYGGGFYDTYLRRLRPGVPRVAAAFDLQVVATVPRVAHDLTVDLVVTETRVLRAAGAPSRPPSP